MVFGIRNSMKYVNSLNRVRYNGFSLLELIIVIAVLSMLLAISLPLFFSVVDAAAARAVQQNLTDIYKGCQAQRLGGKSDARFNQGNINGYIILAVPSDAEVFDFINLTDLPIISRRDKCIDESTGTLNNFLAINENPSQFPRFFIYSDGQNKYCQTGAFSQYPKTFDVACKGVMAIAGNGSKDNLIGFWQ